MSTSPQRPEAREALKLVEEALLQRLGGGTDDGRRRVLEEARVLLARIEGQSKEESS